jgi:hypothetical protein
MPKAQESVTVTPLTREADECKTIPSLKPLTVPPSICTPEIDNDTAVARRTAALDSIASQMEDDVARSNGDAIASRARTIQISGEYVLSWSTERLPTGGH